MSRILVVDDEPDIRMTLRLVLELAGHEITEAENGRQALDLAPTMPDVIILDIRMPDIDGLEVLALLKGDPAVADIPVVCVSAHSSGEAMQRAVALGAVAYINKPFDFGHLRAVIAAAATDAQAC